MNGKQSAQALEKLREMVFSGELAAGSNHYEADLASRLGMSRTPVREAALNLQAQGLVDVQPRRGIKVLPLSANDMADIYDVLCELESLAAQRAAEQGYSAAQLSGLSDSIIAMNDALVLGDRTSWAKADDAFHTELIRLGGNPRVVEICAKYTDQVRRARALTLPLRPLPVRSNEDHADVLAAIAQGNGTRAREIHHAHRAAAKVLLVDLIRSLGLKAI